MKTIIRKKVGAFLLSLTFLIGLLPGGSVTAAAACAVDSHTPGSELHAADWNNVTGGYAYDYYLCTVCGAACDEDGYDAMLVGPGNGCSGGIGVGGKRHVIGDPYVTACAGTDTAQYYYCKACRHVVDADGTIVDLTALNGHTPGNTLYPADYAPCTGGCKTSYYRCTVCNLPCDANGDGSVYTPAGPQPHPHTPGSVLQPANWDSKNGGYIRSYYTCTVCDTPCDAKGHAASYVGPGENCPMGLHTPGSEKHEPDYTPCSGGIKEEWYECDVCGAPCDAKGNTLEVLPPIGHTPGSEKHEPNYSPCSGGIKEYWYECEACGQPCDADGNSIEIHEPTGSHTPGFQKNEPNYTPCGGGFKDEWYECETCHQACDAEGNSIEFHEPTGSHTPGSEKHEPDYTPCGGGCKDEWYECEACGQPCDADGNSIEIHAPTGSHTPGSEKHEPDYTPCGGGFKDEWYECETCHQPCDAEGNSIEFHEPTGSHTPGPEKHEPDYTPCNGGFKDEWYECETCGQACDADGNPVEGFEPTGLHTPGSEKHEPNYIPCSGGIKEDWYECETCGQACDADGNPVEGFEPTGLHTPGSEKHEPNYIPCSGGIKEDWYECETCGQPCDAEGNSIEIHEPTGSHHLVEVPAKDPTYEEDGNSAYWVCSDCQALFKDAEGATPIEDESEIVIPKLDKPNEKPDETPEKPASGTLETVVSDGLAKVPSSVVSQYPTTDNVYEAMIAAALKADPAMDTEKAGSVLLDVTLRIKNANGTITRVTARNFPSEGVEVLLPYPEGTDETFTFVVAHMITTGSRAGEIEILPNTSEKGGIRVRFMSLSPVTITYRASNTPAPGTEDASKPAPSDPADPDDSAFIDKAPQTGVNNPLFWSFAALLCGGIVLACLAENKKRNR